MQCIGAMSIVGGTGMRRDATPRECRQVGKMCERGEEWRGIQARKCLSTDGNGMISRLAATGKRASNQGRAAALKYIQANERASGRGKGGVGLLLLWPECDVMAV